jgi:hypothetical protein
MNRLVAFLTLAVLATTARADERIAAIRDGAGLFQPEVVAKDEGELRTLARTYQLDLVLETIKELTPDEKQVLDRDDNPNRAFLYIARERARNGGVHGVYILISKIQTPKAETVTVIVYPEEYRRAFTEHNCEQVRKVLAGRGKSIDEKLTKAVTLIGEKLKANRHGDNAEGSWFGWSTVALIVGVGLGLWLLIGLLRMSSRTDDGGRPGIVPGLLGGMFGSVAGHWVYDTLIRSPKPSPHSEPPQPVQ